MITRPIALRIGGLRFANPPYALPRSASVAPASFFLHCKKRRGDLLSAGGRASRERLDSANVLLTSSIRRPQRVCGSNAPDEHKQHRQNRPTKQHKRCSMLQETSMPDLLARTAPLYERVREVVPPIEWPVFARDIDAILALKRARNAVILAHNYQTP